MLANLDGVIHTSDGDFIFEAKTTNAFLSKEWEDGIPDSYMLQVQHYMAVTGYMGAYIAVLIGGNTFKYKFIERDDELIEMLIQLEKDFWNHVQEFIPPPLDGSNASAAFLNARFPDSIPLSKVELPLNAVELIRRYDAACEQLKLLEEQKQEAENLLKQMLGEHEYGIIGDIIITWKSIAQERLDSKTFKIKHPKLYKKYANQTSHRRFSVKSATV